jgi:hypothetical protein
MKKVYSAQEVLKEVIIEMVEKSKEYDKLNSPIERVKSKELGRISARERCLRKVRNL